MSNYKRKKIKESKKLKGEPKNGYWSRMTHKWWLIEKERKRQYSPLKRRSRL